MADEYLKLRQFIIERSTGAVGFSTFVVNDMLGNKLMESLPTKTNTHSLKDSSGKELCRLHNKTIDEPATEILDTSDKPIAIVEVVGFIQSKMQHTLILIDASGNSVAFAVGNMLTVQYDVFDHNGKKLAMVGKKTSGAAGEQVIGGVKQTFQVDILEENDTLLILEFIIAIDYMLPLLRRSIAGAGHPRRGGGPVITGGEHARPGEGGGITL